jgi:hypothetical protein
MRLPPLPPQVMLFRLRPHQSSAVVLSFLTTMYSLYEYAASGAHDSFVDRAAFHRMLRLNMLRLHPPFTFCRRALSLGECGAFS